jgi:sugar fermentation stimulation protein A
VFLLGKMLEGRLVRRYKRFLADIELLDGRLVVAHCVNSGAMTACLRAGARVFVTQVPASTTRKLLYTWQMIEVDGTWVGVNTALPNAAVAHFVATGQVPELAGYSQMRREVRYGAALRSRIDLWLGDHPQHGDCHVEVKNTTMRVGAHAAFPDSVTVRGQKHLRELTTLAEAGERAVMFYFMGRADCARFRPADEVDPAYGALLRAATLAGVEVLAYRMGVSPQGIALLGRAPVDL